MDVHACVHLPPLQVYEEEEGEEGEEGGDEGGDALEDVVAAACDMLPVLAGAAGADTYAPVLASQHLPALLSRLKPRTPEGLRGIVVGGIAEVAERMQVIENGLQMCCYPLCV